MRVLHISPAQQVQRSALVRILRVGGWAGAMVLAGVLLGGVLPQAAVAAEETGARKLTSTAGLGYSLRPSKTEPYAVCPPPAKGNAACMSIAVPGPAALASAEAESLLGHGPAPAVIPNYEGSGEEGGFSPKDLREAYKLPEKGGSEQTVAIVDAYDDPNAESDLKAYRKKYGLSECTKTKECFTKVNQEGKAEHYPTSEYPYIEGTEEIENWGVEISLDLDMVSAACPECKILLVEANNRETKNLYLAENAAAAHKGTTEISNSWGTKEEASETEYDKTYFSHSGIPITAAAGDSGYGVIYPAASPKVISVGGTALDKNSDTRKWSEEAWYDTGGGCSAFEPRPEWQTKELTKEGCTNAKGESHRLDNDVSAIASQETPVSMYDSFDTGCSSEKSAKEECWLLVGGTSVATPFVAGVEALSTSTFRTEGPEAFYKHQNLLFDVASGSNSSSPCTPPPENEYLCTSDPGYDAPTGNGTPDIDGLAGPSVATGTALDTTAHEASLRGSVNPKGLATHYHFEYGPTTSYGKSAPATEASAGSGTTDQIVAQSVNVVALETYHYRLVATSSAGTTDGEDHTFTTMAWAVQKTPNPSTERGILKGVWCSSTKACIAVGGEAQTLGEEWNGTEWSLQTTRNPTGGGEAELQGVSCSSSTACTAVGLYYNTTEEKKVPLAERWNGTEWSIQTTRVPTGGESRLWGVSCSSSTACTAVGYYYNTTEKKNEPLAERWNGTEWSIQTTRVPTGGNSELFGVSCPSSTVCIAVGWYDNTTEKRYVALAERWNGTEWSIQTTPNPTGRPFLSAVSCSSTTACTAVGSNLISEDNAVTFAERWNGTEWSIQTTPNPPGNEKEFWGVSCPSSNACTAVGSYVDRYHAEVSLIEHWNGTEWFNQATPHPEGELASRLYGGVSCVFPTVCTAVGYYDTSSSEKTLAEATPVVTPYVETKSATSVGHVEATLNGIVNPEGAETKYYFEYGKTVSYGTKTAEVNIGAGTSSLEESKAVKSLEPGKEYHFRIVATNSSGGVTDGSDHTFTAPGWTIESTPNPEGAKESEIESVSCTSSTSCEAVGYWDNSAGVKVTLAEMWNGSKWEIQSTLNPEGAKQSVLSGISCTSATACEAVGFDDTSAGYNTMAEHWNGTKWELQSTPNPEKSVENHLLQVSCTSATACEAVGYYFLAGYNIVTLAEVWNGTKWEVQSTPISEGEHEAVLIGVSCPSSTSCEATGYDLNNSAEEVTLAEHWNGSKWEVQSTPLPEGSKETELYVVSCGSTTACEAVGYFKNSSGVVVSLAESWNGTKWEIQSTPNPEGAGQSELIGVSCASTTACEATGFYKNSSGVLVTLMEHWNGGKWEIQSSPNPEGAKESYLQGLSCTSATTCTAAGFYKNSSGVIVTLVEGY